MNVFYPTVFWSWNGKIDPMESRRQINLFADKGVKGVFIHARSGLRTPYMGEEWFCCFDAVIDEAKKRDIDIWIYDEDGWPSGHAGGRVAESGKSFRMKKIYATNTFGEVPKEHLIAAYIKDSDEYRLTENVEEANFFVYYKIEIGNKADLMYEKSGERFLQLTHEIYKKHYEKYFGNVIKGVFFDESGLGFSWPDYSFYWSESIPAEYERQYGEDIRKDLWKLFKDEEINLFVERFVNVSTKLFKENFLQKIEAWCQQNNLRLTGHFCMEEALHTSVRMTGSVEELYALYDVPGIDFLGRRKASPVLTHQLTSIIHQYDKTDALCEVLGCAGWDASFNQLYWTWKQIGLYGINIPCIHLSAYTIEGNAKFDHPMFFSYQANWWEKADALLGQMQEFTNFNVVGNAINDILVISPVYSLYPLKCRGELSRKISNGFRQLSEELDAGQFLYDYGDERLMEKIATVKEGKIKIGKAKYSFVIIPQCLSLKKKTFDLLKEFVAQGGKILFVGEFPQFIDWKQNDEFNEFIRSFYTYVEEGALTFSKRNLLKKSLAYYGYHNKVMFTDRVDEEMDEEILLGVRETDGELRITAFNRSTTSEKKLRLKVKNYRSIFQKNLITGEEEPLVCQATKNYVWCDIDIAPTSEGCYIAKKIGALGKAYKLLSKTELSMEDVCVGENCATIDCATLRYGQTSNCGFTGKLIYKNTDTDAQVEYKFFVRDKLDNIKALLETRQASVITLNGQDICNRVCGWEIDKCLIAYDVGDLVKVGENILSVTYSAEEIAKKAGERVQVAFLVGEFDCLFDEYVRYSNFVRAKGRLCLTKRKDHYDCEKDLTVQGLWFYRGKAIYHTTIKRQIGRSYLKFSAIDGATAEIRINGEHAYNIVDFYAEYEITCWLTRENNEIEIVLYATDRNLLGPHHHTLGKPAMVGFQSFMGEKCFTDHILYPYIKEEEIYDENYAFVNFTIGKIYLICKEVKNECNWFS